MKTHRFAIGMRFYLAGVAAIALAVGLQDATSAAGVPNLNGVWYANGNPATRCSISQSGASVALQNEQGRRASGTFSGSSTLETDWGTFSGGRIRGTISSDLRRIDWSNGTFWVRENGSISPAYLSVPTARPAAEATPEPERLRIKDYFSGSFGYVPIHLRRIRLSNASEGRYYRQCLWFRNVATKPATSIDFSFIVESHSGTVEADFGLVDHGTFTPPVNIDEHCWRGHLWSDRAVRLMEREYVNVKRVTFADGTSWEPGTPFLRGYSDDGTPLAEPIEQRPYNAKATPEP